MIIGIGIDTSEIDRMAKACDSDAFINRCFTKNEIELIGFEGGKHRTVEMATGNFAVKEAVSKALGCGMQGLDFRDIEVLRKASGAPYVNLYGTAQKKLAELMGAVQQSDLLSDVKLHVTITNTKEIATAFVILEKTD